MNRSVWNVRSQTAYASRKLWQRGLVGLGGFLAWLALGVLALLVLNLPAHGQMVDLTSVPGSTIASRIRTAQTVNCAAAGVCTIVIPAQMSTFATGTLPTLNTGVWVLDYRSSSIGLRWIQEGTSTLSAIGGSFAGGAITSAITAPADCAALYYSYTGDLTTGTCFDTTFDKLNTKINGVYIYTLVGGQQRWESGAFVGFASAADTNASAIDAGFVREASGLVGIRQAAATALSKFGGMTNCSGAAPNVGVFCYDVTLGKFRYSENNSALANAFGTTYVNSTTVTAANTAVETNLQTVTLAATNPINAVNKVLRITASGRLGVETATTNYTFKVFYNGVAICTSPVLAEAQIAQNQRWSAVCQATVVTAGASGTVWSRGTFFEITLAAVNNTETATVTVDTTVASPVVKVTCTMGTASANRNCGEDQLLVEVLN